MYESYFVFFVDVPSDTYAPPGEASLWSKKINKNKNKINNSFTIQFYQQKELP
jgi:hypothetical protein